MSKAHSKVYPPQLDRVEMAGEYNAPAPAVRKYLWDRLLELGETPYMKGSILCCSLHNVDWTHALRVTLKGRSVWIRGSLSKWCGYIQDGRPTLPRDRVTEVVGSVLERLGLDDILVRVHSVEVGMDVLVKGETKDYTPYLRTAKGNKPKQVQGARYTHYQGNTRREFKAYDKGEELGIKIPEGHALIRFELTYMNGASSIGRSIGIKAPLCAIDLCTEDTYRVIIETIFKMMDKVLPTGVPRSTGKTKDVLLDEAIKLLDEDSGGGGVDRLLRAVEQRARDTKDREKRKLIMRQYKEIQERYSDLDTERFTDLREAIEDQRDTGEY